MRKNGQLFSLDFIISMVAVTAAIALLIHSVEVNAYSQKEQQLQDELKQVAETAADLLVVSDDTSCEIQSLGGPAKVFLVNCIDDDKIGGLGELFPSGYGYQICSDDLAETIKLNCGSTPAGKDFYEAKRLVVINDGSITKENFEKGTFTSGTEIGIKVRVWKT